MQKILVLAAVIGAAGYFIWLMYKNYFVKKSKCEGCAVHKVYEASNAASKNA